MKEINKILDQFEKEHIKPVVDVLIKDHLAPPPEGSLVSEKEWRKQKHKELMDFMAARDIRKRVEHGVAKIGDQLKGFLSEKELDKIRGEWSNGVNKITELFSDETEVDLSKETIKPVALAETMELSDETIEQFYQCGIRLFSGGAKQEAADVFFVLSMLDYRRHNVWMSLGIIEQQLGHVDQALVAFAMGMLTNTKAPWAYVHSAECYIQKGSKEDATECLETALSCVEGISGSEATDVRDAVGRCRQSLKK